MQREPTKAYAYQPGSVGNKEYIFGVSGPGTDKYLGLRFKSRKDAQDVADGINAKHLTSTFLIALGKSDLAKQSVRSPGGR